MRARTREAADQRDRAVVRRRVVDEQVAQAGHRQLHVAHRKAEEHGAERAAEHDHRGGALQQRPQLPPSRPWPPRTRPMPTTAPTRIATSTRRASRSDDSAHAAHLPAVGEAQRPLRGERPPELAGALDELVGRLTHQQLLAVHHRDHGVGMGVDPGDLVVVDDQRRPVQAGHRDHATPAQPAERSASAMTWPSGRSAASPAWSTRLRTNWRSWRVSTVSRSDGRRSSNGAGVPHTAKRSTDWRMNGVTCSRSYGVEAQLAGLAQHLDAHRLDRRAERQAFLDGVVGAGVEHAQQPRRAVEVDERVVGGGADHVGPGPAVQRADEAAEHVVDGTADHGDAGGVGFGDDGFVFGRGSSWRPAPRRRARRRRRSMHCASSDRSPSGASTLPGRRLDPMRAWRMTRAS